MIKNLSSYKSVADFSEGLLGVFDDRNWLFLNKKYLPISSERYQNVENFSEGLAAVKKDGQWFFINKQCVEQTNLGRYEEKPESFSKGVAKVKKNGEVFYINKQGRRLFQK